MTGSRTVALVSRTVVGAALLSLVAVGASAQHAGPRWQPWIGCWSALPSSSGISLVRDESAPVVCVTPTDASADVVTVTTLSGGKVASTTTIDASGKATSIEAKGCTGTQSARWSADERRLYLTSTGFCEGMPNRSSAIIAMSTAGEWLDIRGMMVGDAENVRVARYRDIGVPAGIPSDIANALSNRAMASGSARLAAGAAVGSSAVIDASHAADPAVVEAWLFERGQTFAVDARTLVALANAGVPARVTDAMIAVSYPKAFAMGRSDALRGVDETDALIGRRIPVWMEPTYDPWGYGGYGCYGCYGGYGYNGRYPGGVYGGYSGGYYYPPVIIVGGQGGSGTDSHGQAIKGRGYTQGESSSSAGSASGRSANPSTPSSSGSSGGSSASPSSAPAPKSEPARTAKPRP